MKWFLASASVSASPNDVAGWLLATLGIVLVVGLLGLFIVRLARIRRRKILETITAAVVIWGALTAGSLSYAEMRQMDWNVELQQRIMSGYYDPSDNADEPKAPITLWTILALSYLGLLGWVSTGSDQ